MDFLNRIKKEMSEGIVRAILTDAGYRVIGLGVESVVREVDCLTALEYAGLDMPKAMRTLPDFLVMDRNQSMKRLVEIKYRARWDVCVFDEIQGQVQLFGELLLVYINGAPPVTDDKKAPSQHMRCCMVRWKDDRLEVSLKQYEKMAWVERSKIGDHPGQWWGLTPIQDSFEKVNDTKDNKTLFKAIQSLQGIFSG